MWQRTDLDVNGVRSAVYQAGDRSRREAILFLHGNPGPADDWFELGGALARFGRLIAPDLPGFGHADRPRAFDFSIAGYARHLAGLVAQLGVTRVHLVMHDFGAAWGARWALDHPEALASVTFINPLPLCPAFAWHGYARIWQTPLIGELFQLFGGHPSLVRYFMNRDNPRPLPRAFTDRISRHLDWRQKMAVVQLYRACADVANTFGGLGPQLGAIAPKTCVIWGAEDPYAPVRYAEPLATSLRDAELHLLDGLGHWPFVEEPARVARLVDAFLEQALEEHAA